MRKSILPKLAFLATLACTSFIHSDAAADAPHDAYGESLGAPLTDLARLGGGGDLIGVNPLNGAPSATIPFELPRARGSAQPVLGLHYFPNEDGDAGRDWTTQLPSIERKPIWGLPHYAADPFNGPVTKDTDRFVFAGSPLVPICQITNGTCTQAPAETFASTLEGWHYFRVAVDSQFVRFFWSPDLRTWRAQDPSGLVAEYGVPRNDLTYVQATDSQGSNAPFRWNLVRQWDGQGENINPVIYRWAHLGQLGRGYLTDIYDTPPIHTDLPPGDFSTFAHHTHLWYEQPPFAVLNGGNALFGNHDMRLSRVDVTSKDWAGTQARGEVRMYQLAYFDAGGSGVATRFNSSYLASVTHYAANLQCKEDATFLLPGGGCGSRALPPITIGYDNASGIPQCVGQAYGGMPFANPLLIKGTHTLPLPLPPGALHALTAIDGNQDGVVDFYIVPQNFYPPLALTNRVPENGYTLVANDSGAFGSINSQQFLSDHNFSVIGDWGFDGAQVIAGYCSGGSCTPDQVDTFLPFQAALGTNFQFYWTQIAAISATLPLGTTFIDVNHDGLLDEFRDTPKHPNELWLSTRDPGTGRVVPFSVLNQAQVSDTDQFADMDGDGLIDDVPVGQYRVVSLGGNQVSLQVSYLPGNGTGAFGTQAPSRTMAPATFAMDKVNGPPSLGPVVTFHDLNGDGLADAVVLGTFNNQYGAAVFFNKDGTGWVGINNPSQVTRTTLTGPNWKEMFGDMDGDGLDDLILSDGGTIAWTGKQRCGRLYSLTNGAGASATVHYDRSVRLQQTAQMHGTMPVPIDVVAGIDLNVPGAPVVATSKTYFYDNPVYDYWRHEFRGFQNVRVRTGLNETFSDAQQNVATAQHHTQVSTTYLIAGCSAAGDAQGTCNPDKDPLRQLPPIPVQVDVFGDSASVASLTGPPPASSTYLSTTINQFTLSHYASGLDGRVVRLLVPTRVDTYLYDNAQFVAGGGTQISKTDLLCATATGTAPTPCSTISYTLHSDHYEHLRRDRSFDTFGNLTHDVDLGRLDAQEQPIDPPIAIDYVPQQVGDGWIWRRQSLHLTGFKGGVTDYNRDFSYVWDNHGNLTDVFGVLQGTLPLVRFHETAQPIAPAPADASQDGLIPLAHLEYDPQGNVFEVKAPNNRCTIFSYDQAYGQLPLTTTIYVNGCGSIDALMTSQSFLREFAVPRMAKDATGAIATVEYDDLGRPTKVHQPDPILGTPMSVSSSTIEYSDVADGDFHWVHVTSGATESYTYLDSMDNPAFLLTKADPSAGDGGNWIASGYRVMNAHQDMLAYEPAYFSGNFPNDIVSASQILSNTFRRVSHDNYMRPLAGYALDGTLVGSVAYHALSIDRTSEAGNLSTIVRDGHARVIATHQKVGSDDLQLLYEYGVGGEITAVTQTHGLNPNERIRRTIQRDSFGRVVLNAEPNTGAMSPQQWRYAYDDAGDLVGTSDARGCGENLTYDGAGRLRTEDYSPCKATQPAYSLPDAAGNGTEALYMYDSLGRYVGAADRGAVDGYEYDARMRHKGVKRLVTRPGDPQPNLSARYAAHLYQRALSFDDSNRIDTVSTGADVAELLANNNQSTAHFSYSARNVVKSVEGSYGSLIAKLTYDVDGLPHEVDFADPAQTTTSFGYDGRRRPMATTMKRPPVACPTSTWGCATGSYTPPATSPSTLQETLDLSVFAYDNDGNLGTIDDQRQPDEWPDGAKPTTRYLRYDEARRLQRVDYFHYPPANDPQVSPFAAEETGNNGAPLPHQTLGTRVNWQTFNYDWRDNLIDSNDDVPAFFDRSIGSPTYTGAGPHQLTGASTSGTQGGTLSARYDESGNLIDLLVARVGTCSAPTGKCVQQFAYDWDEVGNLIRARRWGYSLASDAPYPQVPTSLPSVDLSYAYHQGVRILKTSASPNGGDVYTLNVFDSLRLDGTSFDTNTNDYVRADTESVYESVYIAGAHVIYQANDPVTSTSGHQYVLYETGDQISSTSVVFDRETSELVERVAYTGYGATDSDYRPDRWSSFREPRRLSGNDDDIEVGLVYFGARYYSPNTQQWISADPLTIHGLGSNFNPYAYVGHSPLQSADLFGLQYGCDNLSPGCNDPYGIGTGGDPGGNWGGSTGSGSGGVAQGQPGGYAPGNGVYRSAPPPPPPPPPAAVGVGVAGSSVGGSYSEATFLGGLVRGFVRGGASAVLGLSNGGLIGAPIVAHVLSSSGVIPNRASCTSWTCQQFYGATEGIRSIQQSVAPPAPNASQSAKTGDRIGAIWGTVSGWVGVAAATAGMGGLFAAAAPVASIGTVAEEVGVEETAAEGLESEANATTKTIDIWGGSTAGAGQVRILQTGGRTITSSTANALNEANGMNLTAREWGRALEALKTELRLPNNFHGAIDSVGNYRNPETGEILANILEYFP